MIQNKIECKNDVSVPIPLPLLKLLGQLIDCLIFTNSKVTKSSQPMWRSYFLRIRSCSLQIELGLLHLLENPFSEDHKLQRHVRQHRSEQWVLERE